VEGGAVEGGGIGFANWTNPLMMKDYEDGRGSGGGL